jgi:hypothetical protein
MPYISVPYPIELKNKICFGVNQKLNPGLSRQNFNFSRNQFNPAKFRSVNSKISQPHLFLNK